jgi:hypothetical protein
MIRTANFGRGPWTHRSAVNPLVFAIPLVVLGLPIGLYVLLARGRRRTKRELRVAAARPKPLPGEGFDQLDIPRRRE